MPYLEAMSWDDAARQLRADTIVLVPLGAAAKEHGHHLPLDTDARLARHLAAALEPVANTVVAPLVAFHHYPAFAAYPGSTSLREATARELVADVAASLAAHGPRRFYVLNTGISTVGPLRAAAQALAAQGIKLRWLDWAGALAATEARVCTQPRGSHADETETSLLLHLDPAAVQMAKATRELAPWSPGGFQRDPSQPGTYSPSGVWGDATLATADKGRELWQALVARATADIEALRTA